MAANPPVTTGAHTAGIYADMTLDGPITGTLVAVVDRAKHLPNRKTMGKQDPYCAIRLGKEAKKTETDKRGGQTPKWDQELRFVVHDSPDYYKLKVSVFNDDKKTDLIGESWVNIKELIVPGGGQNDLWHQLNFKGKYAGEIRIELTYYDSRPREELTTPKKHSRRKTESTNGDNSSTVSGPRHATGPREISRRPIPTPPSGTPPPLITARPLPEPIPSVSRHHVPGFEQQPSRSHSEPYNSVSPQPLKWVQQDGNLQSSVPSPDIYAREYASPSQQYNDLTDDSSYQEPPSFFQPQYEMFPNSNNQIQAISPPEDDPDQHRFHDSPYPVFRRSPEPRNSWSDGTSPPPPQHDQSTGSSPQIPRRSAGSSPLTRSPERGLDRVYQATSSAPLMRNLAHRDSPLRNSISHDEPHDNAAFASRQSQNDTFPPQPPYHRASQPEPRMLPQTHRNSFPVSSSQYLPDAIGERSPLQALEQNFSGQRVVPSPQSHVLTRDLACASYSPSQRALPQGTAQPSRQHELAAYQTSVADADDEYQGLVRQSQESYRRVQPHDQPHSPQQQGYNYPDSVNQPHPFRRSTWDAPNPTDGYQFPATPREHVTRAAHSPLYSPTAVSPNDGRAIQRKSITPQSTPAYNSQGLGGIPYSPDSYNNVLDNQRASTAESAPVSPRNTLEDARQREVDKLRALGPIIGNDGREIDPSDHLPADTWAPEPETKNRKPEHVIQIKSKLGARGGRPQPVVTPNRPLPVRGSPQSLPRPFVSAPVPLSKQVHFGSNSLQQQTPIRPLPRQPLQHHYSSPPGPTADQITPPRRLSYQEGAYGDESTDERVVRPAFADYQVRPNSYGPAGAAYQQPQPYLRASPNQRQEFRDYSDVNRHPNSLAAELSTIDIGPSTRGGRHVLRSARAY